MSPALILFAATSAMLAFLAGFSVWRFASRKMLTSLAQACMPLLVFVYLGDQLQANVLQTFPTALAYVTATVAAVSTALTIRTAVKQEHPWY